MKDIKEYSFNVFDNITKERLIIEMNGKNNNSIFYLLGSIISFKYIREKGKKIIIDIINYEEEIIYFNSFNVFMKFQNERIIIDENFKKYLNNRNIRQITYQVKLNKNFYKKKTTKDFKDYVEMLLQVKRSDEISKILIDTFKKSIIEKVTEQLDLEISEFDFQNNLKTKFNFTFYDFDTFNYQKKLTDKHLDGMLFNNFTLNIVDKTGYLLSGFGKVFKGRNALNGDLIYEYMLIDDYVRIEREFFDCISVVGEYLGYNVYIEDNVSFRFIKN